MGPDLYHWISRNPWVSEALYAPMFFPGQAGEAEALAMKYAGQAPKRIKKNFIYKQIAEKLANQLASWVKRCDWTHYDAIGFSVCFHQLFASLAAAQAIKEKNPGTTIIFGGSSCAEDAGQSLLNTFHIIDYIVSGEGESGLVALCKHIGGQDTSLPMNVLTRQTDRNGAQQQKDQISARQLAALDNLPIPDYSGYFYEKNKWFPHTPFTPVLPIEFSRGCWWNKCSFCNLNLQWHNYRFKKASHMMNEVQTLASRHSCLDFTFADNMLPPKAALEFFRMTGDHHWDFNFFAELRSAKGSPAHVDLFSIYRQGGLSTIQVGIEAFSGSLLQKMQKGVSVIENIATMRGAQENHLKLEGNLILHFPGSTQSEVAETLTNLEYVFPYRPLANASFFLGYESPVYKNPQKYGIRAIVNHANNRKLFPEPALSQINLLVKDYRGDRIYQRKIWQPVLQKIKKWQFYHKHRKYDALQIPLLYYREGGDFVLIRQELPDGTILHHKLKGASRQIYLFCTQIRREKELIEKFSDIPGRNILSFLADLQKKRLLFSEKNKFLALAVHFRDYQWNR